MGGEQKIAAILSLLLALGGLGVMALRHRGKLWILLFWFLSPLPILTLTAADHFFPPRYMLHFLTGYALLAGLGAGTLFEGLWRLLAPEREGRRMGAMAFLAAGLAIGPLLGFHGLGLAKYYGSEKQDWRSAMQYLGENIQVDDKIVVGDLWSIHAVWMYREAIREKSYRIASNAFSPDALERELTKEKNVWYIHWAPLPDYIQVVVDAHLEEVASFPGSLGHVRILRNRNYISYLP